MRVRELPEWVLWTAVLGGLTSSVHWFLVGVGYLIKDLIALFG